MVVASYLPGVASRQKPHQWFLTQLTTNGTVYELLARSDYLASSLWRAKRNKNQSATLRSFSIYHLY